MELTPEQLVAEFQDAVMELYFARKRIAHLETENAELRARLTAVDASVSEKRASAAAEALFTVVRRPVVTPEPTPRPEPGTSCRSRARRHPRGPGTA